MYDMNDTGLALTHPLFRDVYFILKKKFYIKEKNCWKIKVVWKHRRTKEYLAKETLLVSPNKMREFIKFID